MERVNKIIKHPGFLYCLEQNAQEEKDRRFCRHDLVHLLDVARIARIINAEEGLGVENELIYGAALLHDCGRFRQYRDNTPHAQAGAILAPPILKECGFGEEERQMIVQAISVHSDAASESVPGLSGLLYRADKASRSCFLCKVGEECRWDHRKKNRDLLY